MNDATGTKIGHVQLSGSPGRYELLIDGQRIECAERGFSITFDGGVPIVTMEVDAFDIDVDLEGAKVRKLTTACGWCGKAVKP